MKDTKKSWRGADSETWEEVEEGGMLREAVQQVLGADFEVIGQIGAIMEDVTAGFVALLAGGQGRIPQSARE